MAEVNTNWSNLTTPMRVAVLAFLMVGVFALYYFLLHGSITDELAGAQRRHTDLQDERSEAERRMQEFQRVSDELASREALDRENKRVLPDEAEMASFLQDLHRVAEANDLQISLVEPRPEEPSELHVRLPVSLGLSGSFHQLAKFFYNISEQQRAINMENIEINEPEVSESGEVTLDVNVLATTFRRAGPGGGE